MIRGRRPGFPHRIPLPRRSAGRALSLLLLPALLAATLPGPGAAQPSAKPAQDWQLLSDPGAFMTFSWDRSRIARSGDVVQVVVRVKAAIVSPGPGHADFLTEIRCADSRSRIVRTTNYGRAGQPIVKNHPKAKFRPIKSPDTETIRAAVC